MDNSQSSDVFSGSGNFSVNDTAGMETSSYEDLINNTKILLSKNVTVEVKKSTFSELFSSALDDCGTCVTQSLDLVITVVSDPQVNHVHLVEYLDNAVNILRMLCGFLTKVIEATSMSCCSLKTFPTTTSRIIMTVFSHCRDSESLYGTYLKNVEKQLKDLFRICHELQLTYLMVIEKHFIFDLTLYEELCILIEALDINLKIGEIVQTLDVKTMAEQWKAYTMICEKYSDYLRDTHIYDACTKVLCKMTEYNIKMAIEMDQEDKIIVRSLKVASFTIKILLRVCNIFKHAANKNYDHIMELLVFINLNNPAYLEAICEKPEPFLNLVNINVTNPVKALLKELLSDEKFVNHLSKYQTETTCNDDSPLGYIVTIISAIKLVLQGCGASRIKCVILDCIYKWLPFGHIWLNMGLKYKSSNSSLTYGLYDYLLSHTFAMAVTFDSDQMKYLEQKMYESLLGTNNYNALFSSNLWNLLARSSPKQFLLSQIVSLCKVYQKLENHKMSEAFYDSPQHVHLNYTLNTLFKYLNTEEKIRISKQFKITDEKNFGIWTVLGIKNSGFDLQKQYEGQVIEKLKMRLEKLISSGIDSLQDFENLIKAMKLCATASFADEDDDLEDSVMKCWMMSCPQANDIFTKGVLDRRSKLQLRFFEALLLLTTSMFPNFRENYEIVKILHVTSSLVEIGNTEFKLLLTNQLLKYQYSHRGENQHLVDALIIRTFKSLLQDNDDNVQNKFWNELRLRKDVIEDRILLKIFSNENMLQDRWNKLTKNTTPNYKLLKENLKATTNLSYEHKCIENENVIELSDSVSAVEETKSNNFELADIDTLFEIESDSEPASKRVKFNTSEAEEIIARLEKDVTMLSKNKENIASDYKIRIRILCEKLVNIID